MSHTESPLIVFPVTRIYWSSLYTPREMFMGEHARANLSDVRYGFSVAAEELPEELRPYATAREKDDGFYVRIESRHRVPILGPGNPGQYLWDLGCMGYNLDVLLKDTPMEIAAIGYEFNLAQSNIHQPPGRKRTSKVYPQAIRLKLNDVLEAEKRYVSTLGFSDV